MHIITYKCSNPDCSLNIKLIKGSIAWAKNTPPDLLKVPVALSAQKYVEGHYDQFVCKKCGEISKIDRSVVTDECPHCHEAGLINEGDNCHICGIGIIGEDEGETVIF